MNASRSRGGVIAAVVIIGVPMVVAAIEAAWYVTANRSNGSFVSSGENRDYLVYVPRSYDRAKATPLVLSLHGAGLPGASQREISQWNGVADRAGFIVVYPSGVGGQGPRIWREDDDIGRKKDVRFLAELIDTLEARYDIDRSRIYVNGLSNGGGMSFVLSCAMSDRIAAVGMVAAAQLLPWKWCTDQRPVPMIDFHGTSDPQVPYTGGKTWVAPRRFPNVQTFAANWARRNRCAPDPVDTAVATDVTRRTYVGCANDASVVLYTVQGGGHTWPGGRSLPEWFVGKTSRSVDATEEMWAFFSRHRLGR